MIYRVDSIISKTIHWSKLISVAFPPTYSVIVRTKWRLSWIVLLLTSQVKWDMRRSNTIYKLFDRSLAKILNDAWASLRAKKLPIPSTTFLYFRTGFTIPLVKRLGMFPHRLKRIFSKAKNMTGQPQVHNIGQTIDTWSLIFPSSTLAGLSTVLFNPHS